MGATKQNFRAAMLLGLITSSFSTVVSTLLAARIGRDVLVDWMVVATIPARDGVLYAHPPAWVIATGILFHQWADFTWEVIFFGVLGRWTADKRPWTLLALAVPWAVLTSALEWCLLVPVLPFRQPLFPLEQVYWLGLSVHLISASMYPLFPFIRDWISALRPSPHRVFAGVWGGAALVGMLTLGVIAWRGYSGHELGWGGLDRQGDQAFMRRMAAHHSQGVEVALLAVRQAQDPHLRALANLMAASQAGENEILRQWWRGWFEGALPPATAAECATMPGMLSAAQVSALSATRGPAFDSLFVELMSYHHRGAITMSIDEIKGKGDLRLKLMALAIRHEQTGEIALMHGVGPDFATVGLAVRTLSIPSG
jgi:uncharacterized protein (DUF305 family)